MLRASLSLCFLVVACGAPARAPAFAPPPAAAPAAPPAATAADAPETKAPPIESAWRSGTSHEGTFSARWRPLPDPIPVNESFELEVQLFKAGTTEPWPGAHLIVDAGMPQHGHGMLRRPVATDRGDGSYHVKGMLFHMVGTWQLYIDVRSDKGVRDRLRVELDL